MRVPIVGAILLPIAIENPFAGKRYPESGEIMAVVDTGFSGFALVPKGIFETLGLDELEPVESIGLTADGRRVPLRGVYALIALGETSVILEGLVETAEGVEEVLLGMELIDSLAVRIDGCGGFVEVQPC